MAHWVADLRAARVQGQFMKCFFEALGLGPPGGRALPHRLLLRHQKGLRDQKQRNEILAFPGS